MFKILLQLSGRAHTWPVWRVSSNSQAGSVWSVRGCVVDVKWRSIDGPFLERICLRVAEWYLVPCKWCLLRKLSNQCAKLIKLVDKKNTWSIMRQTSYILIPNSIEIKSSRFRDRYNPLYTTRPGLDDLSIRNHFGPSCTGFPICGKFFLDILDCLNNSGWGFGSMEGRSLGVHCWSTLHSLK